MKKQYLRSLLVLALIVPCMVMLAACGSTAGFSSEKKLMDEWLKQEKMQITAEWDGKMPAYASVMAFYDQTSVDDPAGAYALVMSKLGGKEIYELASKAMKDKVSLMKAGKFETTWNATENKFNVLSKEDYNKMLAAAKAEAASYTITKAAAKDETATNTLQNKTASANKTVAVWTMEYEYQAYSIGSTTTVGTGEKVGTVQKMKATFELIKKGSKWFLTSDPVTTPIV